MLVAWPFSSPLSPMDRSDPLDHVFYLTGPTASGKSAVGNALARRLDAEILALDSMTLYRGMDIGTAKPSRSERALVPHHLIDMLDPWESASVASYRDWASKAVAAIRQRGRRALFVGGTPLYLKALLRGLFEGPPADPALRRELDAEAVRLGSPALHARLARDDPATAAKLHPNDRRRIIRALEVLALTGSSLATLQTDHDRPAQGARVVALQRPRPEMHRRIDHRVLEMFNSGLIDEVRRLQAGPRPIGPAALQGVGYREVLDLLAGRADYPATVARIQARTRQFAKRQETWFRGLAEVKPWPVARDEPPETTADRLLVEFLDEPSTCTPGPAPS
jgi:tRNA dimethylallyltransferase